MINLGRDVKLEVDYDDGRILSPRRTTTCFCGDPGKSIVKGGLQ